MSDREAFEKWYFEDTGLRAVWVRPDERYTTVTAMQERLWRAWQAALQSGEPVALERVEAHLEIVHDGVSVVIEPDPEGSLVYYDNVVRAMQSAPQPVVEGSVPMSDYKQLSALCSRQGMRLMDYEADLEKMVDALEKAATHLREAAEVVADWGAYADDYFKNKHNLQADIKLCKDRADAIEALLSAGKETV
jgi:hypothetical protein